MYFKIIAEGISNRIFNIARHECQNRGSVLRIVDNIGDKNIMVCRCDGLDALADIVSTLETERSAFVLFVENHMGKNINFRGTRELTQRSFHRYSLSVM